MAQIGQNDQKSPKKRTATMVIKSKFTTYNNLENVKKTQTTANNQEKLQNPIDRCKKKHRENIERSKTVKIVPIWSKSPKNIGKHSKT